MDKTTSDTIIRNSRFIMALLAIICVIAIGAVLSQVRSVILPLALAVFLSFLINPLITIFEKLKMPSWLATILAVVSTLLILFILVVFITNSIQSFTDEFPKYQERVNKRGESLLKLLNVRPDYFTMTEEWKDNPQISALLDRFSVTGIIMTILGSFSTLLSNIVMVLLFLLFILLGRNQLAPKLLNAFNSETSTKMSEIIVNIKHQIQKYILTKTLISLLTAGVAMIILSLFGIPFVLIWGFLTFLLNFIPNIGSIIATLLPLTIAIIQFDNLIMLLWLGLSLAAVQVVVGNFLDPKLVGKSVNLSPVVVLFSLIFWGYLWGIIGMFLSVPISVIIKIIFENIPELRFISVLMSGYVEESR